MWREKFYAKAKVKAEQAEMMRLLQEQIRIKEEKKKLREKEKFDYKKNGIGNVLLNIAQAILPLTSSLTNHLAHPLTPLLSSPFLSHRIL